MKIIAAVGESTLKEQCTVIIILTSECVSGTEFCAIVTAL
jgi:hypothetical protein